MNPLRMTGTSSIGDRRIDRGVLGGEVCVRCGTTWLPVNCDVSRAPPRGPPRQSAALRLSPPAMHAMPAWHSLMRPAAGAAAGQPLLQPPPRHSGEGAQRAVLRPKHGR
jgi:hypothetical protein